MKLLAELERELHAIGERGLYRRRRIAETPCRPHIGACAISSISRG